MIAKHELSLEAKMVLYLDCWTVHRSKEFRAWMKNDQSHIILIYVPANCTGVFKPCDVLLQRLFKHSVRKSVSKSFRDFVIDQLKNGIKDTEICLPTKLGSLRDATPQYCVTAVDLLNKETNEEGFILGLKSWTLSRVQG